MEKFLDCQSSMNPQKIVIGPTHVDVSTNVRVSNVPNQSDESTDRIYTFDLTRYTIEEYNQLLGTLQSLKITKSKEELSNYLLNNPILFNDKYYSVTQDKQTQLLGTLNMYKEISEKNATLSSDSQIPFTLTWNATGEPCEEWTYDNLSALLINIYAYVKRLVTEQQYTEVMIKNCTSKEELELVMIDYDHCPNSTIN